MRIVYNEEFLFNQVDKERQKVYFERIKELADHLKDVEGPIPKNVIDYFKIKKMKGTNKIFKFYLNNQDGARCLFMYEEKDNEIFEDENGIILLRAVSHDEQGIIGKKLDNKFKLFEDYLILDKENNQDNTLSELELENELGKKYFKTIHYDSITLDDFINKMKDADKKGVFKLSNDQQKALNSQGPVFIRGSAGSGKTLVIVSRALKNAHNNINQAYFTFTEMLKDTAKNLYVEHENMRGIVGKTSFYSIHKYFLDELKLKEYSYFSFQKFKRWYESNKFSYRSDLNKIDIVLLWTEIRGLIKGYVGKDYYRISIINNITNILSNNEVTSLENQKIIKRVGNTFDKVLIIDSKRLYERYKGTRLHYFLINNDTKEILLDEESYINNLVDRYSPFTKAEKKTIYNFVKNEYQKYLNDNNLFDDNDLARLMINKINVQDIKIFDHMLIDEVQDLTEMQIIALIRLTHNVENVVMAGDISQVINPTFFEKGRTGLIFRNLFNVYLNNNVELKENYRNNENIVQVITKLLDIRQDKLGTYTDDIRETSVNLNKSEGLPIYINLTKKEILKQLHTWIGVPKVAIITANHEEKEKLMDLLNVENETNIYTVHEIKGQEFSKILCYNIATTHEKEWEQIMHGEIEKGGDLVSQYKYYFNLLYVAMTRGIVNLYYYEENKKLLLINQIIDLFEQIDINTLEALDVSVYDSQEGRLGQAEEYFNERDYRRAKTMYLRLNNREMVQISDAYYDLESGNIEEGLLKLIPFQDRMKEGLKYIDKEKYKFLYLIYSYNTNQISIEEVDNIVRNQSIINMAKKYREITSNYAYVLKNAIILMQDLKLYQISKGDL